MLNDTPSRRRVLFGVTAGFGLLAGCTTDDSSNDGTDPDSGRSNDINESDDTDDSDGTGGSQLDLREANVVDVSFEADGGSYRFDVSLHHDDDGEDGYADWWQVERLDGTRLGRRELLHAHSEQPFTRSATIEIPDGVSCVVVRGHDQRHGYGGQMAVVTLDPAERAFVDQGSSKQLVSSADCP